MLCVFLNPSNTLPIVREVGVFPHYAAALKRFERNRRSWNWNALLRLPAGSHIENVLVSHFCNLGQWLFLTWGVTDPSENIIKARSAFPERYHTLRFCTLVTILGVL